jgi:hypothetical protein
MKELKTHCPHGFLWAEGCDDCFAHARFNAKDLKDHKFDTSKYVVFDSGVMLTTVPHTYLCDTKRHLICLPYSVKNLHRMAKELGIKKAWYHTGPHPHYDIPVRRYDEIRAKCVLVPAKEIVRIIKDGLHTQSKEA